MLKGTSVSLDDLLALSASASQIQRGSGVRTGEVLTRVRGRGLDLDEVRQYQPGDDIRNIDWNVTARKQVPHTKVFREERERPTLIVVDQCPSMYFGSRVRVKSVVAAELAARITWQTLANRDRIGGVIVSTSGLSTVKPIRSQRTVARLFREIVAINRRLDVDQSSDVALRHWQQTPDLLKRIAPSGHRIVLISDFFQFGTSLVRSLFSTFRHNEIFALMVSDSLESELPPANDYTVTHDGQRMRFHSSSRAIRETYRSRRRSHISMVQSLCLQQHIFFANITTDQTLDNFRLII